MRGGGQQYDQQLRKAEKEQREAFVADILSRPNDDLPKLIYADWLEERGHYDEAEVWRDGTHLRTYVTPGGNIHLDIKTGMWIATIRVADLTLNNMEVPFGTREEAVNFLNRTDRENRELPSGAKTVRRPNYRSRRVPPRH